MLLKVSRVLLGVVGIVAGLVLGTTVFETFVLPLGYAEPWRIGVLIVPAIVFGLIGFIIAKPVLQFCIYVTKVVENRLAKMPVQDILSGFVGLLIGLVIAAFLGEALRSLPFIGSYMPIVVSVILGYIGLSQGIKRREDLIAFAFSLSRKERQRKKDGGKESVPTGWAKVLDTSVIIDGRIADVCETGFIEGPLVIPKFVLEELRHIADSSDALKRNRGRRGLDVLNVLQHELDIEVIITDEDYPKIGEVDDKLIQLAIDLKGCVVTNDYNLNKVAQFQSVTVLNVNELAGAIKTVVLPGEEMLVSIIKDGKEHGQGLGYLDDGTMIVVENGRQYIGETRRVVVTSVIQTNAGRMIFVKPL